MSQSIKLALVQTSVLWENPKGNIANLTAKIDAIVSDVDMIVLPEMFTSGFTMNPQNIDDASGEETLKWMKTVAKRKGAAIIGSIPWSEDRKYTNRLFFVRPNKETDWYDKRHTFTLAGEDKVYESGNQRLVVDFKGFRICPMICYDLRFPVWARYLEDYDVLLYVANWPKPRIQAWDALLKARAIENMAYCIGVNRIGEDANGLKYTGHSAIYDALGNRKVYSDSDEILYAEIEVAHVQKTREKLRFLEDRDDFSLK